ncbi:MAG: hypothetical protein P4K80_06790 [Acidobacteriaceae bacterium]|nr:hypothetical protein [Acidobacteriaceae bacterium]
MMAVPPLPNAPFQAVNTLSITDGNGTRVVSGKIARNSDGSVYQESWKPGASEPEQIFIVDVPNHQFIQLYPGKKTYTIRSNPNIAALKASTMTTEQQIQQAEQAKPKHIERAGLVQDVQPLGKKEVEGVVVIGELITNRKPGVGMEDTETSSEKWASPDLQLTLLTKTHDARSKTDSVSTLSHVVREEPDLGLFRIPVGYQSSSPKPAEPQASAPASH